jgi:hypothetical protein
LEDELYTKAGEVYAHETNAGYRNIRHFIDFYILGTIFYQYQNNGSCHSADDFGPAAVLGRSKCAVCYAPKAGT